MIALTPSLVRETRTYVLKIGDSGFWWRLLRVLRGPDGEGVIHPMNMTGHLNLKLSRVNRSFGDGTLRYTVDKKHDTPELHDQIKRLAQTWQILAQSSVSPDTQPEEN